MLLFSCFGPQWERWDSMLPNGQINPGEMTSFNHYALGAVADFLHSTLGGLSPLSPGWESILFRPRPGGTITSCRVQHVSPYGDIVCEWQIVQNQPNGTDMLWVKIHVPPNCTGVVELATANGLVKQEVGSGTREYEVEWCQDRSWPPQAIGGPQVELPLP